MTSKDTSEMQFKSLPDAQSEKNLSLQTTLDWVGMRDIELPLVFAVDGSMVAASAKVDAMVNLINPAAKGIHMSRLYLILQERLAGQTATTKTLQNILQEMLETHQGLSDSARLCLSFSGLVKRKALKSENYGWRSYPMMIEAVLVRGEFKLFVSGLVTYSSTCPASAALSRRLIQEKFVSDFKANEIHFDEVTEWLGTTQGIVATPHSQRSEARVTIEVDSRKEFSTFQLINLIESTLKTAVQGAVKREDEQEFARLNGSNLMFCEDAARRVQAALDEQPEVLEFVGEFLHLESLHPHNAMARIRSSGAKFSLANLDRN